VVFASDAPLAPIPVHVTVLDQVLTDLKLGADVRHKMMCGNAEKLLNMSFK
jgi:predicted TIM-barrel fold metal-dependent hydrolase